MRIGPLARFLEDMTVTYFHTNQSLSHGTMRNEDLLQSFGSALQRAAKAEGRFPYAKRHDDLAEEAFGMVERLESDPDNADYQETAGEIVNEMFDALQHYAPEGTTFGAHEGDGSDYGFWAHDEDTDEEFDA